MTAYTWTPGAHISGVPAQVAGEALESMRIRHNGHLTPRAVVDESRPEEAPLHPVFEWNDGKAAEQWREQQARHVIGSVRVVYEDAPAVEPSRAFVSVEKENRPVYTATRVALSDAEMRGQVLRRALAEVQAWQRRYAGFSELAQIFAAIDASEGVKLGSAA